MAMAAFHGLAFRAQLVRRRPLFICVHKARECNSVASREDVQRKGAQLRLKTNRTVGDYGGDYNAPEWKKLASEELGIQTSMIGRPIRLVLDGLKKKGYEVYLVGGCVRDLVLRRTPKDFDIITSAELHEVQRTFPRSQVVGKRFPICIVPIDDTLVEVSSFSTSVRKFGMSSHYAIKRPPNCNKADFIRWKNCLQRDFTINGLMFDPFARIVYDYMGGLEDIRRAKVRSIVPANTSFLEDCGILSIDLKSILCSSHFTRGEDSRSLRISIFKRNSSFCKRVIFLGVKT